MDITFTDNTTYISIEFNDKIAEYNVCSVDFPKNAVVLSVDRSNTFLSIDFAGIDFEFNYQDCEGDYDDAMALTAAVVGKFYN